MPNISSSTSDLNFNSIGLYTTYKTYSSDTTADINFVSSSHYLKESPEISSKSFKANSLNEYKITCACCGRKFESLDVKVDLCKDCMEELADDLAFADE